MAQYIDKDALVAEIERLDEYYHHSKSAGGQAFIESLLSFINTLEVKEVNLVEELDYDDYMTFFKEHPEYNNGDWGFEETWTFGQYCYKLGLKAQKE